MKIIQFFRRMNPGVVLPMACLILLGLCFVQSTTGTGPSSHYLIKQLSWTAIGLLLFLFFARVRYRNFLTWAWVFYAATVLLLIAVLFFGKSRGISQSWLSLGPFTLQPSEFAKLSIVLILARYLGASAGEEGKWGILSKGLGLALLPVALVLAQPDLGTTLVFVPILLAMLWVGGAKGKHLIILILAGMVLLPVAFSHLKEYQRNRLLVFLNPDMDPLGAGYNIIQSKVAIGSGGLLGKGYGMGTQNRLKFLPERHTDFIFSIVGEEIGWWGGMLILILFFIMFTYAMGVARKATDPQAKLLVVGLTVMIFSHVLINVGVSLGVMPVTGLPLPFISYGGSSLITCMAAIALISNVGSRRLHFN